MFRINTIKNDLEKLDVKLFKELNIKEKQNLQEWIAKNPEILGEELIIIQKEFDGFNDTNERLDLLALDKSGGLVIIENKLDDSGKDVVWQVLKYTSYCSTLTNNQIINIFQEYLNKWFKDEDAVKNLEDFFDKNINDIILNNKDQRIILVANNYRKEVTSTVLWLLAHNIQIQCFKATPYQMSSELLLQLEQIIPLPETNEFIINIKEKEKEVSEKSKIVENTNLKLIKFWDLLKQKNKENNIDFIDKVASKPEFSIGFWKGQAKYAYCIGRKTFRVEIYFAHDKDKKIFDKMRIYEKEINSKILNVIWERLDNKKASRIKIEFSSEENDKLEGNFNDEVYWDHLINWYSTNMSIFYNIFNSYWIKVQKELK